MKLKEILEALDKSSKNKDWISFSDFAYEQFQMDLDFVDPDKIPERFTCYWFVNWRCTDTQVGGRAYFLDGVLIGASWQPARKSEEEFYWISQEAYDNVHAYFQMLKTRQARNVSLSLLDLEEEFDVGFSLLYSDGVQTATVLVADGSTLYKEAQVEKVYSYSGELSHQDLKDIGDLATKTHRVFAPSYIRVRFADGTVKCVAMENIRIPYNIK